MFIIIVCVMLNPTANDPNQVNLSSFNVHCVAGAMKKYLRELPNPVIPVDMYDAFMAVAQQRERGTTDITKSLVELIAALPGPHQSTLQYLMAHFIRLWKIQHESEVDDGLDKLSHVFCHILLRPPWEKIMYVYIRKIINAFIPKRISY